MSEPTAAEVAAEWARRVLGEQQPQDPGQTWQDTQGGEGR